MQILNLTRNDINQQPLYLKLSRMSGELSGMLSKLHSYQCEPCTSEMYDQFHKLEQHGRKLKRKIDQTQLYFREDLISDAKIEDNIECVVNDYDSFQQEITSYFSEATLHH